MITCPARPNSDRAWHVTKQGGDTQAQRRRQTGGM